MSEIPSLLISAGLMLGSIQIAFADQSPANMAGMEMSKPPTATAQVTHSAVGVVKQVDDAAGKVTISHGAIPTLSWPAMTMTFAVKDKSLFNKLAVGKTVAFELTREGSDYVVTSVK